MIVGVMPPGFENALAPTAEIWANLGYDRTLPPNGREWGHNLQMVGRLRRGVDPDAAGRELQAMAQTPLAQFPRPQWASLRNGFVTGRLQDELTRGVRPALLAISGAVALLLCIACVNVANCRVWPRSKSTDLCSRLHLSWRWPLPSRSR